MSAKSDCEAIKGAVWVNDIKIGGYCDMSKVKRPASSVSNPPVIVNGDRTWRVSYRIGNLVQSINVFANGQNDAITYAKRIVGNFNLVSVQEFNACSMPTNNVITTRFNY